MTYLDIGVIGVVGITTFSGLKKGLARSIFDLIGMAGGVFVAIDYHKSLAMSLQSAIKLPGPLSDVLMFVLIWVAVFFAISAVGRLCHRMLSMSFLGPFNRVGGGAFGFAKGIAFLLPFLLVLVYFEQPIVEKSVVVRPVMPWVRQLVDRLPQSFLMPFHSEGVVEKLVEDLPQKLSPEDRKKGGRVHDQIHQDAPEDVKAILEKINELR